MQCYFLYAVSSNSNEENSIGAAIGITFVVTLILSVAFTLFVVYIVYKVWIVKQKAYLVNQKTTTDIGDNVPLSAEPMVSAKNSNVYDISDNVQFMSNPQATIQLNSVLALHKLDAEDETQVSDNIE